MLCFSEDVKDTDSDQDSPDLNGSDLGIFGLNSSDEDDNDEDSCTIVISEFMNSL
jgi:hypothetical protein